MNKDSKNWTKQHPILTGVLVIGAIAVAASAAVQNDTTLIWVIGMFACYFLPTIIAASKSRANTGAVFALNLLLGWTVIGWVIALIWALTNNSGEKQIITIAQTTSQADELKKLSELKDSGILSQEEFERQKQVVLKG